MPDERRSMESPVEFGRGAARAPDGRLDAAAFHRNQAAIAEVLVNLLGSHTGHVLEVGSGTGQHAVAFARLLPGVTWWPTEFDDERLRSIEAWRKHSGLGNVMPPVRLDAAEDDWQLEDLGLPPWYTVIFCANVIHISPWRVAEGLFAGAGRHLRAGGELHLYGPFLRDGAHTAPSNAAFDESLRRQNPEWGVRDTADLNALAKRNNLKPWHVHELPANNAVLTFQQSWW